VRLRFDGVGTVAVGAAEFMFKRTSKDFDDKCKKLLSVGFRVLAVGYAKGKIVGEEVGELTPVAIIALQDTVRADATKIIKWFVDNDVAVKVISGDNPLSVSVIAKKVGVGKCRQVRVARGHDGRASCRSRYKIHRVRTGYARPKGSACACP